MKRLNFCSAVLLALISTASCSDNFPVGKNDTESGAVAPVLTATFEPAVKTTVIDGGTHIFWEPGEQIMAFSGSYAATFVSTNAELAESADFKCDVPFAIEDEVWAVYPADACIGFGDGTATVIVPGEQTARAGSFDKGMNVSIARSITADLQFYNICGGLRFKVERSGLRQVQIRSVNDEILAGKAKVAFVDGEPVVQEVTDGTRLITLKAPGRDTFEPGEWYYVNILPVELPGGLELYFYGDGVYGKRELSKSLRVKRSSFGSLSKADTGVAYAESVLRSDVSKPEESGMVLVEFLDESTAVVQASDDAVPQVGQIIYSGPTEDYPCGFYAQVESVELRTKAGVTPAATKGPLPKWAEYLITVNNPLLGVGYSILSSVNVDEHKTFYYADFKFEEAVDGEGYSVDYQYDPSKCSYKIINHPFELYKDKDTGSKITVTPNLTIFPKYYSYDIEIEDGDLKRLDFDIQFDADFYTEICAKVVFAQNKNKMIPLWSYIFPPVVAGPVTFTPLFTFYAQVKADASVSITYVPFYLRSTVSGGFKYDGKEAQPYRDGKYFSMSDTKFLSGKDLGDIDVFGVGAGGNDIKLKGEVKGDLGASLSVGLYGCNYLGRIGNKYKVKGGFFSKAMDYSKDFLALEAKLYLEAKMSAQFEYSDYFNVYDSYLGGSNEIYKFNDKVDIGLYDGSDGKAYLFGEEFSIWELKPGDGMLAWRPFKNCFRSLLFADYEKVSVGVEHGYAGSSLTFTTTKFPPLFGYGLFPELNCGFCYQEVGHNALTYLPCEPYYDADLDNNWSEHMTCSIPPSDLTPGSLYTVYPYSKLGKPGKDFFLYNYRTGTTFRYNFDGSFSNAGLPNIPGENL